MYIKVQNIGFRAIYWQKLNEICIFHILETTVASPAHLERENETRGIQLVAICKLTAGRH